MHTCWLCPGNGLMHRPCMRGSPLLHRRSARRGSTPHRCSFPPPRIEIPYPPRRARPARGGIPQHQQCHRHDRAFSAWARTPGRLVNLSRRTARRSKRCQNSRRTYTVCVFFIVKRKAKVFIAQQCKAQLKRQIERRYGKSLILITGNGSNTIRLYMHERHTTACGTVHEGKSAGWTASCSCTSRTGLQLTQATLARV